MFRKFVGFHYNNVNPDWKKNTEHLFRLHPLELTTLLELVWDARKHELEGNEFGHPYLRSELIALPKCILDCLSRCKVENSTFPAGYNCEPLNIPCNHLWHHLIYAFLIENTRICEIFERVIYEFSCGEKFGAPTPDTQHWLRNTEELFYRHTPPFFIISTDNYLRPDARADRRNLYHRMFGLDLNHGKKDGTPYPYKKAETANNEFVNVLEKFLYEVWVGIINTSNTSGANPTSLAVIGNLANQLFDMLRSRRIYGNLSRREYRYVSMMEWFHLTLEDNSSLVVDLRAEASSPEQRLFNIAKRVEMPAHAKAEQFFRMAPLLSKLLILIETGVFNNNLAAVKALYTPGVLEQDIRQIISDWEVTTGRNIRRKDYSNLTLK